MYSLKKHSHQEKSSDMRIRGNSLDPVKSNVEEFDFVWNLPNEITMMIIEYVIEGEWYTKNILLDIKLVNKTFYQVAKYLQHQKLYIKYNASSHHNLSYILYEDTIKNIIYSSISKEFFFIPPLKLSNIIFENCKDSINMKNIDCSCLKTLSFKESLPKEELKPENFPQLKLLEFYYNKLQNNNVLINTIKNFKLSNQIKLIVYNI